MQKKTILSKMIGVAALLLAMATGTAAQSRTGYAVSVDASLGKAIYTFDWGDTMENVVQKYAMDFGQVSGGCFIGDKFYYVEYAYDIRVPTP